MRTIVDRLTLLPPADRATVDEAIFPEVLKLRAGLLRLHIEAEILKVNPEAAKERHKKAREDRGVDVYPALDGVCDLRIRGISHDVAAQIWGYLDAIARTMKSGGDERTLPQLRADIAASLLSGEADVIICNGPSETSEEPGNREGAGSREQTSADAEGASEDCDCENGDGENGEDATPRQESFDDLLDEQNNADSPSEAEGAQDDSATEPDGCRHTGCGHDLHLEGCPCEDCKPATYTHPLDRPRRKRCDDNAAGSSAGSSAGKAAAGEGGAAAGAGSSANGRGEDADREPIPEQEIPAAFRSWRAGIKAKLQLNVPFPTLMEWAKRPAELGGFGPIFTDLPTIWIIRMRCSRSGSPIR